MAARRSANTAPSKKPKAIRHSESKALRQNSTCPARVSSARNACKGVTTSRKLSTHIARICHTPSQNNSIINFLTYILPLFCIIIEIGFRKSATYGLGILVEQ